MDEWARTIGPSQSVDWAHGRMGPDDWAQPVSRLGPASWSVGPTLGRLGPPPWRATSYPRGVGLPTVTRYSLSLQIKIWWQRRKGRNTLNVNYRVVGLVHRVNSICLTNMGTASVGLATYWGWPDLSQGLEGVRVPKQREVSRAVGTSHAGTWLACHMFAVYIGPIGLHHQHYSVQCGTSNIGLSITPTAWSSASIKSPVQCSGYVMLSWPCMSAMMDIGLAYSFI